MLHALVCLDEGEVDRDAVAAELSEYRVTFASGSRDASRLAGERRFDVVITDLHPDGVAAGPWGLAVIVEARAQDPPPPCVLMCREEPRRSLRAVADATLRRPWSKGALAEAVEMALARRT